MLAPIWRLIHRVSPLTLILSSFDQAQDRLQVRGDQKRGPDDVWIAIWAVGRGEKWEGAETAPLQPEVGMGCGSQRHVEISKSA